MNYDIDTPEGMQNAVAWQQAHLERIAQGGFWIVPRSLTTYTIDHERKVATKGGITGGYDQVVDRVFRAMGWTVVEEA